MSLDQGFLPIRKSGKQALVSALYGAATQSFYAPARSNHLDKGYHLLGKNAMSVNTGVTKASMFAQNQFIPVSAMPSTLYRWSKIKTIIMGRLLRPFPQERPL